MSDPNPYQPPVSNLEHRRRRRPRAERQDKASRGVRLVSAILNGVFALLAQIPLWIDVFPKMMELQGGGEDLRPWEVYTMADPMNVLITAALTLPLLGVNVYFLAVRGQSLGKMILGIKIVRSSGRPAGLVHTFLLREVVVTVINYVPIVGTVFSLVDLLLIFGSEKRCIHDRLADTIVVNI